MISGIHGEVLAAASYALFLAGVAFCMEILARHSHKRTNTYRNAGFVYFQGMDLWECPAGRQLLRNDVDYERRVVRYRASAEVCNKCSLKNNCTDSNEGRVLESRLDSWVESELRRFHRGISLVLLFLATVILAAESIQHSGARDLALIGILLVPICFAETALFTSFLIRRQEP